MSRTVIEFGRENRLEGWLDKYCDRGPLKGFKRRFIAFNPSTLRLECFKQTTDKIPLDHIDIQRSALTINCQDELPIIDETGINKSVIQSTNSFRIICGEKVWILRGESTQCCIKWLKNLQKLRKRLTSDKNDEFDMLNELDDSECLIDLPSDHRNSSSSINSGPDSLTYSPDQNHQFNLNTNSNYHQNVNPTVQTSNFNATSNVNTNNHSTSVAPQSKPRVSITNILTKIRKTDSKNKSDDESGKQCHHCKELENQIIILQDDLNAFENEMYGNKEVIKVLQSQIEQILAEKETYEKLCKSLTIEDGNQTDELVKCECELSKVKVKLKQVENLLENYKNENESLREKILKLKDENKSFSETIRTKDQIVMGLTNEILNLEKGEMFGNIQSSSFHSYLMANSFPTSEKYVKPQLPRLNENELEKLKDSVAAFQAQNQFLNREIIELSQKKRQDEVKLQRLEWTVIEWEAKCCQIQSKLLSLLKEINHIDEQEKDGPKQNEDDQEGKVGDENEKLIAHNERIKQIVQRLLMDEHSLDIPMSWKSDSKKNKKENMIIEYDDLGFQNKLAHDVDEFDEMFSNIVPNNQLTDLEEERLWKEKWDSFISTISNSEQLNRTTELKHLLRSGVPQEYRGKIWRMCVNRLVEHKKPTNDPNYYANLIQATQQSKKYNPSLKQIELDLLRTLPNNKNFESKDSDGIMRLKRVLTAYSQRNPVVGYCQGMNRLAAVALLFLSEEDSFWCLVAIIESIQPKDYYTQSLLGAFVDQYVLKDLIAEKLPNLHAHFERHAIEISLFSWFLTCFIDNLPTKIFLRIWDVFLFEGSKVLFRFSLAFLKYHEQNLLSLNDAMSLNQYLRVFGEKTYDIKHLCNIAFNVLNPFPISKIKAKRDFYRLEVSKDFENTKHTSDSDKTIDSQSD